MTITTEADLQNMMIQMGCSSYRASHALTDIMAAHILETKSGPYPFIEGR